LSRKSALISRQNSPFFEAYRFAFTDFKCFRFFFCNRYHRHRKVSLNINYCVGSSLYWTRPESSDCRVPHSLLKILIFFIFFRVRKQVVNIPSFVVRLDSQKHIDFSLKSPFGGGRPGRVKRKNSKKEKTGGAGGDDEE